jgi:hypothetical protein
LREIPDRKEDMKIFNGSTGVGYLTHFGDDFS